MKFVFIPLLLFALSTVCVAFYLAINLGSDTSLIGQIQHYAACLFAGAFLAVTVVFYQKSQGKD